MYKILMRYQLEILKDDAVKKIFTLAEKVYLRHEDLIELLDDHDIARIMKSVPVRNYLLILQLNEKEPTFEMTLARSSYDYLDSLDNCLEENSEHRAYIEYVLVKE